MDQMGNVTAAFVQPTVTAAAQLGTNISDAVTPAVDHNDDCTPASMAQRPPLQARGTMSLTANIDGVKRENKTLVEVRVVFLKIGEIDTLKEQYSAEVFVQARWREPKLDDLPPEILKTVNLAQFWNPVLYIENLQSESKYSIWQTVVTDASGLAYVFERRKVRGIFLENLELENFPLDVQDLSVMIVSERCESEVEIIPDTTDLSTVNFGTFADEQEWKLYEHVEVTKKTMTPEFSNQQRHNSALQITCRAARRPGYFYYNVFLVMFFISSIAFGTFSVDCRLPQNRLQLSYTLLLTSIAFKMVINQSLPKISYLTFMDKYVLMSLVFLVLICVWHSIVPSMCSNDSFYASKTEIYIIVAFLAFYIVGHVLFAVFVYIRAWKRRLIMAQNDRELQVYIRAKLLQQMSEISKSPCPALFEARTNKVQDICPTTDSTPENA